MMDLSVEAAFGISVAAIGAYGMLVWICKIAGRAERSEERLEKVEKRLEEIELNLGLRPWPDDFDDFGE